MLRQQGGAAGVNILRVGTDSSEVVVLTYTGAQGDRNERSLPKYGLGFRIGDQIKFYSQTLYWLVRHIGFVEVAAEFLDDGELVIYGKLSCEELDALIAQGRLSHIRNHYWGVSWTYGRQTVGADDDFVDFEPWRDHLLTSANDESDDWNVSLPLLH